MGYLKFVSYAYLVAAAFFIYNAIISIQEGENGVISFIFAGIAIFMFFFRRSYQDKFSRRDQGKK